MRAESWVVSGSGVDAGVGELGKGCMSGRSWTGIAVVVGWCADGQRIRAACEGVVGREGSGKV